MLEPNISRAQIAIDPRNGVLFYKDGSGNLIKTTLSWLQQNYESISTGDDVTISTNLTVQGNLTVNGDTVTVNVSEVFVEDNYLILNSNVTGSPTLNSGLKVNRGSSPDVEIRWNESTDKWQYTIDGTNFLNLAAENDPSIKWSSPITLTLSGDLTGNVSFDGSENITLSGQVSNDSHNHTATTLTFGLNDATDVALNSPADGDFLRFNGASWINDPVNLMTDTVGDYVGKLQAGTNVTVTNNSGESATPNVSVTGNITSIDSISSPDYIQFDDSYAATPNTAKFQWDSSNGTMQFGLFGGNVNLPVGQKNVAYVYNAEATTLTRGTAVYLYGANGDRASVKRADNRYESTSSKIFGIVAEDITSGSTGFVTTYGIQTKLDLATYNPGDMLWLGESGQFTATKPSAPKHLVFLGVVERANSGNGLMFVHVQNGYEIQELHNVNLPTPNFGDVLTYDGSLWTALQPSGGVSNLDNIGDVAAPSPVSGEFLKWNGTAWVNGVINSIDDIQNVSAATPSYGQFLKWDGAYWIPDTVSIGPVINQLDDISDVSAATPSVNQTLQWDGSRWVADNVNASNLSGTTLASGVTSSSLTSVGNLSSLTVSGTTTVNGNLSVSGAMNDMATPSHTSSYELQLSDANKVLYFGSTVTVRVPGSGTNFAVGTSITIIQDGSGTVTILPVLGSGVSLLSFTGATPKTRVQYSAATIVKKSATQWFVFGDIMP